MSDTTTCPSCEATVPSAAAFCTSCGQPVAAATPTPPAPAPPPPAADPTNVDGQSFGDETNVQPAPPTDTPWNPPASPPPPTWQQPAAPPPSAPPQPTNWTPPGTAPPPGAWGAAVETAPAASSRGGSILGGIAALLGGLVTLGGVFSGWVKLGSTGTISGWSMTTGDELLKSKDPYLLVLAGIVAVLLGILLFVGVARPFVRVGAIIVGIATVTITVLNWLSISSFVTDNFPTSFEATTAIGFYLALVGGILTAVSGLLPAKK